MSSTLGSLAEARELHRLLQMSAQLVPEVEKQVKPATVSFTELRRVAYETIDTLDAFGLGRTAPQIMAAMRQMIYLMNMLTLASHVFTATTPAGMLIGAFSLLTGAVGYKAAQRHLRW